MKPQIKLFADFNNADTQGRIRLNTYGTFKDIEAGSIKLIPGLEVLLDDNDELQAIGIVEFSESENIWVAKIVWDNLESTSSQ